MAQFMNPVGLLGRWTLAIVAAIFTAVIVGVAAFVMYVAVDAVVLHEAKAQIVSHAMSSGTFAVWLAAIGGISAGTLTLFKEQMPRPFLALRWILAFCTTVCVYLVAFILVRGGSRIALHQFANGTFSISFLYNFTNVIAVSIATYSSVWAGTRLTPSKHQKACVLFLCAALAVLIFLCCGDDLINHNFGFDDLAQIAGTMTGFYRIRRGIWSHIDSQIADSDKPAPPPTQKQHPVRVKYVAASRPSFGRRG